MVWIRPPRPLLTRNSTTPLMGERKTASSIFPFSSGHEIEIWYPPLSIYYLSDDTKTTTWTWPPLFLARFHCANCSAIAQNAHRIIIFCARATFNKTRKRHLRASCDNWSLYAIMLQNGESGEQKPDFFLVIHRTWEFFPLIYREPT